MDRSRYPDSWPAISLRIREREGWRCGWCGIRNGDPLPASGARCVLTVHHIGIDRPDGSPGDPGDKHDVRDDNLLALCQPCHLRADLPRHIANAAATRRRRRIERGQTTMELMP